MGQREKVLITVMTYPHPSEKFRESVCTAGVTASGEWIRLYPVDYRYQPRTNQFRKPLEHLVQERGDRLFGL